MIPRQLLHFGDILAMNAYLSPDKIGARDLTRALTFRAWNDRSCKLANALVGLGLEKGDRIAVLAYNCLEWMEIYAAVAKAGLVVVPINFRLIGSEIRYIVENSEAKAVIVQNDLLDRVETIRGEQVVLIIGDGGVGISGFDLETARRYSLPIVAILWNNSSWGPSFDQMPFLKGRTDPFEILPKQRYDRMFELMDCHGEHVERPEEFRPALERALRAGKTALVNVISDCTIGHPGLGGNLLGSTRV
jgi:acyl-CoA synthetase (AMP-forming)/AMP-acid ligase II